MNNVSKTLRIIGLTSIGLWVVGSIFLFNENNGKLIISITAVIIIAGLYSQLIKERKANTELH
jgi:hypothetical protein